jgi:hypothetical protein
MLASEFRWKAGAARANMRQFRYRILSSGSAGIEYSYCLCMGLLAAGGWGLLGGLVASLVGFGADIKAAGFRWPWHGDKYGPWPRLWVFGFGFVVGMVVAAAAHAEMTGAWPALLMGVGAPSVVKGAISRIEVSEIKPATELEPGLSGGAHDGSS